ncbi:FAD-dependent oxidoreductase [Patulibacter sp. NPDC049589]|uniref:oxidoreductase n=1 Tax=Patulibacter sp. NPDC049589 TaxID=3154731 RepID=UPI00341925C8
MSAGADLDVLWEPLRLGGIEVPNRIFVSAHLMALNDEEIVGDRFIEYYEERARGGVGLLVTGAEGVTRSGWKAPHFQAWREDAQPRYRKLAAAVHAHGTKIFTQLWHAGLQSTGIADLDFQSPTLGPSAVQSPAVGRIAKAMEREDIQDVIEGFARSAELAQRAGIDGVEVSGAHGYLLNSFLSRANNRRTDEYGGSVENRCRAAVEIATEIRRRCGRDFPVGMRLIFDEFVGPGGFEPDDSAAILAELHGHGLFDYFGISGGTYHSLWASILPMTAPNPQPYLEHGARAREVVRREVPIAVASGLRTVELAAQALRDGKGDLVAMTRAHLADPQLVAKARAGRTTEIRRCVGANQGCVMRQANGTMSTCTVNPAVGRERRFGTQQVRPAAESRRLLIVGGGPGGLKAAEVAAEHGHHVTLVEAGDTLGGNLRHAQLVPGRARWAEVVEDLERSVRRLGVEVRLGTTLSADDLAAADADLVVLATGATYDRSGFSVLRPDRQTVDGFADATVLDPIQALRDPGLAGDDVIVLDDFNDQTGIGVALSLAQAGKKVHIVTMSPFVGSTAASTLEVPGVAYPILRQAGVEFRANASLQAIGGGEAQILDVYAGTIEVVPASSVVVNMLRIPVDGLYLDARARGLPVVRIGDCLAPRYVDEAIYEATELGFDVEREIAREAERERRRRGAIAA